jgi:hypothetical protein
LNNLSRAFDALKMLPQVFKVKGGIDPLRHSNIRVSQELRGYVDSCRPCNVKAKGATQIMNVNIVEFSISSQSLPGTFQVVPWFGWVPSWNDIRP